MQLILTRTDWPASDVAMGALTDGVHTWQTLQHLPTPAGFTYELVPHVIQEGALKGLKCYALRCPEAGVFLDEADAAGYTGTYPVRIAVLIHIGNWPKDTIGCIIIGLARDTLSNPPNVANSTAAFGQLMGVLGVGVTGHTLVLQCGP